MNYEQKIRLLEERIVKLEEGLKQRAVVQTITTPSNLVLAVNGGNTLETGQNGIKYQSGTITSVPSAYDPNVTTSFIDGIGRGFLYKNGVIQSGYVLIVNDDRGTFRNALVSSDGPVSTGAVAIQVGSSSSYVMAYTVG